MSSHPALYSRREMLRRCGTGLGMLGLAGVLTGDSRASGANPLAPRKPHFPGKAKHVIHLFMNGGPSHVDSFDPKPALTKYAGKPLPAGSVPQTERKTSGVALASPWKFRKRGKSGLEISDLFPHVAESA